MLKEAIDRVAELGVSAAGIEIRDLCNRKKLVRKGNVFEVMTMDPPEKRYEALDCDSFVAMVNALAADPIVLIDGVAVLALLDENEQEGRVFLHLSPSRAFKALDAIGSPTDQKKLIAYLREELAGCIEPRFLAVVRRLDFARRNDGMAHVQHGRELLGKSVEAAVQSAEGEIPEVIVVTLPAWTEIGFDSTIQVRCAVSVDPVNEKITVRPIGEELQGQLMAIRDKLRAFLQNKFMDEGADRLVVNGSCKN